MHSVVLTPCMWKQCFTKCLFKFLAALPDSELSTQYSPLLISSFKVHKVHIKSNYLQVFYFDGIIVNFSQWSCILVGKEHWTMVIGIRMQRTNKNVENICFKTTICVICFLFYSIYLFIYYLES